MIESRDVVPTCCAVLLGMVLVATAGELQGRTGIVPTAPSQQVSTDNSNPLTSALRSACAAKNPATTRATILELRSTGMGAGPYVLLGWCIRPDRRFQGRFDDELFGVFVVDSTLTRIDRTLDLFPTQRWADYFVSIEKLTDSEVTVIGRGSYGDQPLRKVYSIREDK